jgi:hypothetical protein
MEYWWERNEGAFDKYRIKVAGHAERVWLGGEDLFVSLMCKLRGLYGGSLRVRRKGCMKLSKKTSLGVCYA